MINSSIQKQEKGLLHFKHKLRDIHMQEAEDAVD